MAVLDVRCVSLNSPANGMVKYIGGKPVNNSVLEGTNATFTCNQGYVLNGNQTLQCSEVTAPNIFDGQWTSTEPSCAGMRQIGTIKISPFSPTKKKGLRAGKTKITVKTGRPPGSIPGGAAFLCQIHLSVLSSLLEEKGESLMRNYPDKRRILKEDMTFPLPTNFSSLSAVNFCNPSKGLFKATCFSCSIDSPSTFLRSSSVGTSIWTPSDNLFFDMKKKTACRV